MLGVEAFALEVEGVEAPGQQRFVGIVEGGVDFPQPFDDLADVRAAGPDPAVGVLAVEEPAVGVQPVAAGHGVAVGFDEAGEQHLVGQRVVDGVVVDDA